jgi:hypothetical protein
MGEQGEVVTPDEQIRQLFGQAEKQSADAAEQLVHSNAFGELLARSTENIMGLTKIGFGMADLVVRNLRLAGKPDLVRLGEQLARNEDKLERVLQEVERLQDQVEKLEKSGGGTKAKSSSNKSSSNGSSRRSSSRKSRSKSSSK